MRKFSRPMNLFSSFLCFPFSIIISIVLCTDQRPKNISLLCIEKEKHALLTFKQSLSDPGNRLSSWSTTSSNHDDCCLWEAVRCSNVTGHVVELHLGKPDLYTYDTLGGEISSALLELEFLSYLNLSGNYFGYRAIPSFLGSMGRLEYLDLSDARFGGVIPPELGNLSTLRHLDLSYSDQLYVENLRWITHLSFLRYINMIWVDLHREIHWLECLSMSPSLLELHLSQCQLGRNMVSSIGYANFTSLTVLDVSWNNIHQEIPYWLFNLTHLAYLDLRENQLIKGQIPVSLGQLKYLEHLDLSSNSFGGPIPTSIGNLSSLRYLGLSRIPLLNGTLPQSLGLLSNLEYLELGGNSMTGAISEVHFTTLSKLKTLVMFKPSFSFHVNSSWTPPFQLEVLYADSFKMGVNFPAWLQTQKSLSLLYISRSGIVDTAPSWFWELASSVPQIYLSNNQISGNLSHVVLNSTVVDLSCNCFSGQLPLVSPNVAVLNIAKNSFEGQISPLCQKMKGRRKFEVLDLSNNALSGELPNCWRHSPSLTHINLGSNNLSGQIPNSMGSLFALKALSLHNNSLHGDIPLSLGNCRVLELINLSENNLSGTIPRWVFERTTLAIIQLRSNRFMGNISPQICKLSYLAVLDLSVNSLSGTIPKCLNNISAMAVGRASGYYGGLDVQYDNEFYMESLTLDIKGRDSEYKEILQYVKAIDLSSNKLSGSIPVEIFNLSGLQSLNLSHNYLEGAISVEIGGMKNLESLDLSRNHLSGEIPQRITSLTFLDVLNLSYNNLSGRIPLGTQIQTFTPLSFSGNAELCGAPLSVNCTDDDEQTQLGLTPTAEGESREFPEIFWFSVGMGGGFIVGFWGVCGSLYFKRAWRNAYFEFVDDIKDWAYVGIAIKWKWFRQKLGSYHTG